MDDKYIIFYSWQSDLPNNINRNFLQSAMEKAIKDIKKNDCCELEPVVDRDTKGISGSPNISQTIFEKIENCDVFVADISIVTGNLVKDDKENKKRPSPNPNVLLELGYAIAILGWDRIILYYNEAYGNEEDIPFDIRQHRQLRFHFSESEQRDNDKNQKKQKELVDHFKSAFKSLIKAGKKKSVSKKEPNLLVRWYSQNFVQWCSQNTKLDSGLEVIQLERANRLPNIEDEIKKDIECAKKIDGSPDKNWNTKLNKYFDELKCYLSQIKNTNANELVIEYNREKIWISALQIENIGNAKATNIKINMEFPEWIIVVDNLPEELPKKPITPSPKYPMFERPELSIFEHYMMNQPSALQLYRNLNKPPKTQGYFLNNNTINFWADELLHKHSLAIEEDGIFYLLASPKAQIGEVIIKGEVFCAEFDDYENFELKISVKE